jgi:DNA helicase II / ATP-dependent DNA helicase PcrA
MQEQLSHAAPERARPELNPPQAESVSHAEGPLLVFAGAGSGKTRVITYRIANLVATHRVPPYRILAVTFTNKAAGEMRERLTALAGADVARDLWVGTFHATCARLLRRYHDAAGLSRSFVIYDDADQKALMTRIIKREKLDEKRYPPRWVLSRIHAEKREGRLPDDVEDWGDETLLELFRLYQRALGLASAVDFEDLILYAMRLAEDEPSAAGRDLRERFAHVLVDEFQDTNLSQYRLVRALAARRRNLCVVGDDDQSIYRWRGADVRIIRGFTRDFPDAKIVKLEQNYRSTGHIVAAALGVIEPALVREPKELWTASPKGEPVRVRGVTDEREEGAFVVRTIQRELAGGVDARQIAVFYRVHAQSRVLEDALRAQNVPYQIIGGIRFFERAEVKDLLAYLRLIENPASEADFLRVVNTPNRGIGDRTVKAIADQASDCSTSLFTALNQLIDQGELGAAVRRKLEAFRDLIEELREQATRLSPSDLAQSVLSKTGYRERLEGDDSAESDARLENLQELVGSIQDYEQEQHALGETPTLGGYLERVSLVSPVDTLQDVASVSLMTVHAAKGLEFTTVFITGMEEEVFPYKGMDGSEPEELDEERRLAYVAVTRARERLYVTHTQMRTLFGRTRYGAPSRFLLDLPREAIAVEGHPPWPLLGLRGGASRERPLPGQRIVERDEQVDHFGGDDDALPRPGGLVMHPKYGRGRVVRVEPGPEPKIIARFQHVGEKTIVARFLDWD